MIVLYRFIPFVLAIVLLAGMYALVFLKWLPVWTSVGMTFMSTLLLARLLRFEMRTPPFWNFLLTPILFLVSTLGMIFFLEREVAIIGVAVLSVGLLVLYAEYLFQFIHLPANYQPYSLEYISLLLNVLTIFLLSTVGFGSILLLQIPLLLAAIPAYAVFAFIIHQTFWVSKAHEAKIKPYTFGGSVLMTEFFVAVSFLPSGFYTNAAIMTILFYLFIGLTRAHVLRTLSSTVIKRYLVIGSLLLLTTIVSSQWL